MRPLQSGAGEAGALLPEVAGDPPRALLASYSSGIDYLPCGVKAKVRFSRMSCIDFVRRAFARRDSANLARNRTANCKRKIRASSCYSVVNYNPMLL